MSVTEPAEIHISIADSRNGIFKVWVRCFKFTQLSIYSIPRVLKKAPLQLHAVLASVSQDFACISFGLNIPKPHICLVQNIYELCFNKKSMQRFFCLLQLFVSFVILKKNLPSLFHQHQKVPHKVPAATWMLFLNGIALKFLPMNHNGLLCTLLLQDPPQQHKCWCLLTRGSAAPLMLKPLYIKVLNIGKQEISLIAWEWRAVKWAQRAR